MFCVGSKACYWSAIPTRSATHAADCVFTQFRASRPALILYTGSIVPSGHSALYFPMLAIFKNHTKYRSSRRHVFTHAHMMARCE